MRPSVMVHYRAIAALTAVVSGLVTIAFARLPQLHLGYAWPAVRLALETSGSLIALFATFLVFGRLRRRPGAAARNPPRGSGFELDRVADRDLARFHGRAVDPQPGVSFPRDDTQDRRVPGQSHRVYGDHHASLVAIVHAHPQPADAQHPADPVILGEVAPGGIHQEVGPEPPGRKAGAGQPAKTGQGLRGQQRQGHRVEDAAVLLDDAD